MERKCRVIAVKPDTVACVIEDFDCSLESLQAYVGGYIEEVIISPTASLIVNEEGKLMNLPLCRFLERKGKVLDILVGNCLIIGVDNDSGNFKSLTEEEVTKYLRDYSYPSVQI